MIFPTAVFTEDLVGLRLVVNRFLGKFGFLCLTHLYNICMCNTLLGPLQEKNTAFMFLMAEGLLLINTYKVTHAQRERERYTCVPQQ